MIIATHQSRCVWALYRQMGKSTTSVSLGVDLEAASHLALTINMPHWRAPIRVKQLSVLDDSGGNHWLPQIGLWSPWPWFQFYWSGFGWPNIQCLLPFVKSANFTLFVFHQVHSLTRAQVTRECKSCIPDSLSSCTHDHTRQESFKGSAAAVKWFLHMPVTRANPML